MTDGNSDNRRKYLYKNLQSECMNAVQMITLPITVKPTLAMGADNGNSVCSAERKIAYISPVIGDLSCIENFDAFKKNIKTVKEKLTEKPQIIVCDLHPGYASSEYGKKIAKELDLRLVNVQHHKAHVAAVAAEHGLKNYVGIAMDGLGYGEDGKLWGGEIFDVSDNSFKRVGSLEEQKQIGGDSAAIYPKKMLFGIISPFMDKKELNRFYTEEEINIYQRQLEDGFNVFTTTSAGRVLDAVSALLGVCTKRVNEGDPAIKLERFASEKHYDLQTEIIKKDRWILKTSTLFEFLINSLKNHDKDPKMLAATAQFYLAQGLYEIAEKYAERYDKPIVFAGGVAYNRMISGYMKEKGILLNIDLPPGDAGIAYGQVVVGNQ
jgi:hydrogenase maturation protein HypF